MEYPITRSEYLTLQELKRFNSNWAEYPTYEELALQRGVSKQRIAQQVESLLKKGYLRKARRFKRNLRITPKGNELIQSTTS